MTSVSLFWLAALVLVAITLAALLWPLLRGHAAVADAPADAAAATAVYRDQRRQLDDDLATGAIDATAHATAVDELAQRLGAEVVAAPADAGPGASTSTRAPWVAALALVAVVPAAALVAYLTLGSPQALAPAATTAARDPVTEPQMRAMVDSLAQKMKANPDDPRGWVLLARSQVALGRFPEALEAFAQAAQRMPPDAQLFADWADAAAMTQGRKLAGKPEELVMRALAVDPKNMKALALSATARLERGDVAASLVQWRELRALLPNGSEDATEVDRVIAQLQGQLGTAAPAPAASIAATPGAPAKAAPSSSATGAAGAAISGRIEIDPKVAARVAPDDTVFVVARAVEGPRMPLAVQRFRAGELPRAFRLDDSMAMAPGMTLSSAPRVVVEARVSKSGNAITQSGDVRGVSGPVAPGAADVRIAIGEVVP